VNWIEELALKEMSSKPKSFPAAVVFKSTITIVAEVEEPEFQLALNLSHRF